MSGGTRNVRRPEQSGWTSTDGGAGFTRRPLFARSLRRAEKIAQSLTGLKSPRVPGTRRLVEVMTLRRPAPRGRTSNDPDELAVVRGRDDRDPQSRGLRPVSDRAAQFKISVIGDVASSVSVFTRKRCP